MLHCWPWLRHWLLWYLCTQTCRRGLPSEKTRTLLVVFALFTVFENCSCTSAEQEQFANLNEDKATFLLPLSSVKGALKLAGQFCVNKWSNVLSSQQESCKRFDWRPLRSENNPGKVSRLDKHEWRWNNEKQTSNLRQIVSDLCCTRTIKRSTVKAIMTFCNYKWVDLESVLWLMSALIFNQQETCLCFCQTLFTPSCLTRSPTNFPRSFVSLWGAAKHLMPAFCETLFTSPVVAFSYRHVQAHLMCQFSRGVPFCVLRWQSRNHLQTQENPGANEPEGNAFSRWESTISSSYILQEATMRRPCQASHCIRSAANGELCFSCSSGAFLAAQICCTVELSNVSVRVLDEKTRRKLQSSNKKQQ